jgi:hypothetical protein
MTEKNKASQKDSVMAIVILLLLGFIIFKSRVWIYAALAISVMSVLSPLITRFLNSFWIYLTEWIGKINAWIILSIVFIFILIPISIFKKWFGKKGMILKRGNDTSTFQSRNTTYSAGDFENPW